MITENLFKHYYLHGIRTENKLYSSTGNGKMGFVAVDDIAAAALALLASKSKLNGDAHLIIGPELLTHDEVKSMYPVAVRSKTNDIK